MSQANFRTRSTIALSVLVVIYSAICIVYLTPRLSITNIDYWYHLSVGQQLSFTVPKSLVNGLYPLGYPWLLATSTRLGIDALRFGQILSVVGGASALVALFLCIQRLSGSIVLSVIGSMLLITNSDFMLYATREGNDMLSAGLQVLSIALLFLSGRCGSASGQAKMLILSGSALGLAYLARYTALILLPPVMIFLFAMHFWSPKTLIRSSGWLLAAFLLAAAVQLLPSTLVTGNPFYNAQAKNVWFAIYGQLDWVSNWGKVPDSITLLEVIALDPSLFFEHWRIQVQKSITTVALWPSSIHWIALIAAGIFTLDQNMPLSQRALIVTALITTIGATALAWLDQRFMLVPLWLQAFLLIYLANRVSLYFGQNIHLKRVVSSTLLIGVIVLQWPSWFSWWKAEPLVEPVTINHLLQAAGMDAPRQVATNNQYLHATHLNERTRYTQIYEQLPQPESTEQLLEYLHNSNIRYLVFDYGEGVGDYSRIQDELINIKEVFVPLSINEDKHIFCIFPCNFTQIRERSYKFGSMMLLGYSLFQTDNRIGLYLYWQTDSPIADSYKVSLRIMNPDGQTVQQIDGVPQQWTYPTSAWQPNETIVDFYSWETADKCEDCQLLMLVYNAETSEPLGATDSAGANIGPLVELARLY